MTTLTVTVPGVPVPQGSMKHFGPGRPMESSNKTTLLPWRASVIAHIRKGMEIGGTWPVEGPIAVVLTFYLPKPKSAKKDERWPAKRPDLDKLERAALDALTQSGAIRDDAQVVKLSASKVYGLPGMALAMESVAGRAS